MALHPYFRDVKWHTINQEITYLEQRLNNEPALNSVPIEAAVMWAMISKKEKEQLEELKKQLAKHEHWLQWG